MKSNLSNMMCLDIYLSSLSDSEYDAISHQIRDETVSLPLLSWDVYSESYIHAIHKAQRAQDILKIKSFAKTLYWKNDINAIFEQQDFDAIIVTDLNQKIIWTNDGFTKMTGYSKTEALHKTPRFLQGPETSSEVKQSIRTKLNAIQPFKDVIINYKKNGKPYKCEVNIFPLYTNKTTHYIALERQVS